MNIEAYQIASAVLGAATVGFAHLSYGLRSKLSESEQHVSGLQKYVQDQCVREGELIRERDELLKFHDRVAKQRQNALKKAAEKRAAKAGENAEADAAARDKTLNALKVTPLRTRAEVVADVTRTARQVSSAG